MEILKGYVTTTKEGGRRAQVETLQGEIIDDVLLLYPHGFMSNIQTGESSLVLLLANMGSKTNMFGIPYDVLKQPSLEKTEVAIGNFTQGNKATFKADGNIDVEGAVNVNITASDTVNISNDLSVVNDTDIGGDLDVTGEINTAEQYKVDNIQVVTNQQPNILKPTGGTTVDDKARDAIDDIIDMLRIHGLISPV